MLWGIACPLLGPQTQDRHFSRLLQNLRCDPLAGQPCTLSRAELLSCRYLKIKTRVIQPLTRQGNKLR